MMMVSVFSQIDNVRGVRRKARTGKSIGRVFGENRSDRLMGGTRRKAMICRSMKRARRMTRAVVCWEICVLLWKVICYFQLRS